MFNLRLCNAATIRYSQLNFGHMHFCGMDYKYFWPHFCKCNSFGCIATIRCGNSCHGPQSDSLYSGSEHSQFNSPRLIKREAGFPNPRWALIGSNQLWRVNDSPYYREYSAQASREKFMDEFIWFQEGDALRITCILLPWVCLSCYKPDCCLWRLDIMQRTRAVMRLCDMLTLCGLVTPYGDIDLGQHWFR